MSTTKERLQPDKDGLNVVHHNHCYGFKLPMTSKFFKYSYVIFNQLPFLPTFYKLFKWGGIIATIPVMISSILYRKHLPFYQKPSPILGNHILEGYMICMCSVEGRSVWNKEMCILGSVNVITLLWNTCIKKLNHPSVDKLQFVISTLIVYTLRSLKCPTFEVIL